MPSVAQEAFEADSRNNSGAAHISILAKKRRWDDSSRASSNGSVGSGNNEVVSIYVHGSNRDHERVDQHSTGTTTTFTVNTALSPSQQRKIIPLGSKRLCLSSNASADDGRPISISTSPSRTHHHIASQSLTAPCHICHRKPRRKVDLDSLANCEGCGQRTCFVCLRECLGWTENENENGTTPTEPTHMSMSMSIATTPQKQQHSPWSTTSHGHRRMVCSRCCVERGEDGDVVCLGCVAVAGE